MRLTVAVFAAAAAFTGACAPAAACGFFSCPHQALTDDAYPPGLPLLDPDVREVVMARQGFGLSAAGFYNDPSLAMAYHHYERPVYGASYDPAPPVVGFVDPAPEGGPAVIYSPWSGSHRAHARYAGPRHAHAEDK